MKISLDEASIIAYLIDIILGYSPRYKKSW